jgi:hypothetical protein
MYNKVVANRIIMFDAILNRSTVVNQRPGYLQDSTQVGNSKGAHHVFCAHPAVASPSDVQIIPCNALPTVICGHATSKKTALHVAVHNTISLNNSYQAPAWPDVVASLPLHPRTGMNAVIGSPVIHFKKHCPIREWYVSAPRPQHRRQQH